MKTRLLAILVLSVSAFATTPVTGHIAGLNTTTPGTSAFVRFILGGMGGNQPRITATGAIAPLLGGNGLFYVDLPADASGNISGTIYSTRDAAGTGNGEIEVGGSYTAVYYRMFIYNNGIPGPEIRVHAKNGVSLDIANVTPITTNPVVAAPTGDTTYFRLDGGNSPITGGFTSQGTNIFTGSNTHVGADVEGNLNAVLNAASCSVSTKPTWCAGAEIGAWVNAAYAALPSVGGRIIIPAGSYNQTTAIVFNTAGKLPVLDCLAGGDATVLTWLGSASGTQITFDVRGSVTQHPAGFGLNGCTLSAAGNTATAINFGATNSAEGAFVHGVKMQGFATGVTVPNGANISFAITFLEDVWFNTTTCLNVGATSEGIRVVGGAFMACGTAVTVGTSGDLNLFGVSCDDPVTTCAVSTGGNIFWHSGHFENIGGGLPLYATSGNVFFFGGFALDDCVGLNNPVTGCTATNGTGWFSSANGPIYIFGMLVFSGGRTLSVPLVNTTGNGRSETHIFNNSPTQIPNIYPAGSLNFDVAADFSYTSTAGMAAAFSSLTLNRSLTLGTGAGNSVGNTFLKWVETTAPTCAASAADCMWGDSADHFIHQNVNNSGDQHVPQIVALTSQYTNSTTSFTNVAGGNTLQWTAKANTQYTATCHLYYQAAATGGLNIEFTGPASPQSLIYSIKAPLSATTISTAVAQSSYSSSLGAVVTTATTNFDATVTFSLLNGVNAGTVNLLAKSSAAVQLQIQSGSFCQIQ